MLNYKHFWIHTIADVRDNERRWAVMGAADLWLMYEQRWGTLYVKAKQIRVVSADMASAPRQN